MARQPTLQKGDERYRDAINELRSELGYDNKASRTAQSWAMDQCRKAQQISWPTRSVGKHLAETWDSASIAARKLADHLEIDSFNGLRRVLFATKQCGIELRSDVSEPINAAFTKLLRALAKQRIGPRIGESWFEYGPLTVKFAAENRIKMPSRSIALAISLTHGFRVITESIKKNQPTILFYRSALKVRGGKPCYAAAALFASASFDEATTEDAIQIWIKRHPGRIQFNILHDLEDTKLRK